MNFSESDIQLYFPDYISKSLSFDKEAYFQQENFNKAQTEESLASLVGKKTVFESLLLFWIKAYQKVLIWEEIIEEWESFTPPMFVVDVKKISGELFSRSINDIFKNLPYPPDLISSPFKAYQLKDAWDQRIYLLENEEKYQLVYWDTTA